MVEPPRVRILFDLPIHSAKSNSANHERNSRSSSGEKAATAFFSSSTLIKKIRNVAYILVGIFSILVGIFKIGFPKKSH